MYSLAVLFGNCPHVKIIESIADNWDYKFSRADISRMTDVPKSTVNRHFKRLYNEKIIRKAGKDGKAQLFRLNLDDARVKHILALESEITSGLLRDRLEHVGETPLFDTLQQRNHIQLLSVETKSVGVTSFDHELSDVIQPKHPTAVRRQPPPSFTCNANINAPEFGSVSV